MVGIVTPLVTSQGGIHSVTTLPQVMGPYRMGGELPCPGLARAAVADDAGVTRLALFVPTPDPRDVACERLFHDGWQRMRLEPVGGVPTLHRAELVPRDGRNEWWYAMVVDAYRPSHTIARFIDERGPLGPVDSLRFIKIIARILVQLEQRDLHHGYLHPEQVVLDGDGRPLLTHPLSARAERSMAGTDHIPHGYVAPELLERTAPSMASDCYALGGLLHFVATGRPPMAGLDIGEFHPELLAAIDNDPVEGHPGLDPAVRELIRRAMAVRPDDRLDTAVAFLHAVEDRLQHVVETREGFDPVDDDPGHHTHQWARAKMEGSGRHLGIPGRPFDDPDSDVHRCEPVVARPDSGIRAPRRRPRTRPVERRERRAPPRSPLLLVVVAVGLMVVILALLVWMALGAG